MKSKHTNWFVVAAAADFFFCYFTSRIASTHIFILFSSAIVYTLDLLYDFFAASDGMNIEYTCVEYV